MTRELESIVRQRPILWVGAGLSVAAGYPTTGAILSALREVADRDLPTGEFTAVVDAFVAAVGPGELGDVLQRLFETPRDPTPTHHAIARLALAGHFTAIVTTNYDDLLERALAAAGVQIIVQTLQYNAAVTSGAVRLLKIHGSRDDWQHAILSGQSYSEFDARYTFLDAQLVILLQQYPLLFVGCSLQDPRILQWIANRPDAWTKQLKRWRAVMTRPAWTAAMAMSWKGGTAEAALTRAPLRPIVIDRHEDLPTLWLEVAKTLAPLAVRELVFDVDPGEDQWRSVGPTVEYTPHVAPNPLHDDEVLRDLHRLRALMPRPVFIGDAHAASQTAELRHIARRLGTHLTDTLLSPDARAAVCKRLADVDRGTARLTLRIAEGERADTALALPWELLMPEVGHFAVEEAKLDLVREAIKPGAPELDVPSTHLSVAATIAAPDDQTALRYEDEAYRMLKALAPLGQVAHFAELGEVEDLVELVRRTRATAVHFSGHGLPGELVFEDELGLSQRVPVTALMKRLRQRVQQSGTSQPFPRLFFLASCHGASSTRSPTSNAVPDTRTVRAEVSAALGEGPSTAATLHREGFACVLGYFGPIGDATSTVAEVALYTALSEGCTVLHAVKQARAALSQQHVQAGQPYYYPLGWAQLAVYLRGADRPLTAHPQSSDSAAPAPVRLERKPIEVSGLPVLEHGFIGRRALQHEVRRKLRQSQCLFVLQGLGGLGKTALASQLLCKILARDPRDQLILRVQDAGNISALRTQAEAHGDLHQLPNWSDEVKRLNENSPDPAEGFRHTVLALRRHRPALVLYADNMEALQTGPGGPVENEPGALGSWKPGVDRWWAAMASLAQGGIVLASTRYAWAGLASDALIPLDRMSQADVWRMIDTFPTLAKLPWSTREKVAETADGRPRTLERLEGLLRQTENDPTRDIRDAWTDWVAPVLAQHGDTLTADLLLAQLWRCLSQASRYHAIAAGVLNQPAPRQVVDVLGVSTAGLIRAGLLTRHRELTSEMAWEDRWSMHSSVREFVLAWGTPADLREARTRAANAYESLLLGSSDRESDEEEIIRLHLLNGDGMAAWAVARDHAFRLGEGAQYRAALDLLASVLSAGLHGAARAQLNALRAQLSILAGDIDSTSEAELRDSLEHATSPNDRASVLHALGTVLFHQERYAESENVLRAAVAAKRDLGPLDGGYAASLQTLAGALKQLDRYEEAERFSRDAISIIRSGGDHESPGYGRSLRNLAEILTKQDKHEEAEHVLREAVIAIETALGPDHVELGVALKHLAMGLWQQGKNREAEQILFRVLGIEEKAVGREDPNLCITLTNLAVNIAEQGRTQESLPIIERALAIARASLEEGHPTIQQILNVLQQVKALA